MLHLTSQTFLKTNQYPSYINVNSNHPTSMIKQVPKDVKVFSLTKKIFHDSRKICTEALKNSGFKEEFTYLVPKKIKPNNDNNNNLYNYKETTDNYNNKVNCHKKKKEKLYGSNPLFLNLFI